MKEPLNLFGKRLRNLRKLKGISQKQLGIRIGLDEGVASARLNQYEVGSHSPKFETATKIAKALNVSSAYFYAEEKELADFLIELSKIDRKQQMKILKSLEANYSRDN